MQASSQSTASLQVVNGVITPSSTFLQGPTASYSSNTLVPGATTVDAFATVTGTTFPLAGTVSSASAYAGLGQGTLRSAVVQTLPNTYAFGSPTGQAYSRLRDTLFFTNTSGAAATLTFSYDFEGLITLGNTSFGGGLGDGSAKLYLAGCALCSNASGEPIRFATGPQNGAQLSLESRFDYQGIQFFQNFGNNLPQGPSDNVTVLRGPNDGVAGAVAGRMIVSLLIPSGLTSLGIGADLDLNCSSGASCLFGNSASFSFDAMPAGLTMSSLSGVFLTTPIPEPQTWLLWAGGLLAMAWLRRRHAG